MIISISGASGAGKSTVISNLTSTQGRFRRLTSITTRPPRDDDVSGEVDAVSEREFEKLLEDEKLAWSVMIYGHRYGSLKSEFVDAIHDPSSVLLCDIASDAVPKIRTIIESSGSSQSRYVSTYLMSPSMDELGRRLADRGMDREEIKRRLVDHDVAERRELLSGMYDLFIHSRLPTNKACSVINSLT